AAPQAVRARVSAAGPRTSFARVSPAGPRTSFARVSPAGPRTSFARVSLARLLEARIQFLQRLTRLDLASLLNVALRIGRAGLIYALALRILDAGARVLDALGIVRRQGLVTRRR